MMRQAKDLNEQTVWQEMTPGGEIYEGATSRLVNTGAWRSNVPVMDWDKCRQCLLCALYCPDSSIPVSDGKRLDFDLYHCKGCGICVTACPFQAIHMELEVHE